MIRTNYHTHTRRCGHAEGFDEEYVEAAIQAGIKVLGFSDHAPYRFPQDRERMRQEAYPDYKRSILELKEKYKDKIEIHLGMEVECIPNEWEYLSRYREEMEYCILGQHFLELDSKKSSYELSTPEELFAYTERIAYGADHGLCDYIAHPDVCLWAYPRNDDAVRKIAEDIAEISLKYDLPLELNCGSGVKVGKVFYDDGLRYAYPNHEVFRIFAEKRCKIIIGIDAHSPKDLRTDRYLNRALDTVKDLDLNFVHDYDLISQAKIRKEKFY